MNDKKTKELVKELEDKFPEQKYYDRISDGLHVRVIDRNGKIYDGESEPGFDEDNIDEVQLIYNGDAFAIFPQFRGTCSINLPLSADYKNLEGIGEIIGIIGKHFKNWKELN